MTALMTARQRPFMTAAVLMVLTVLIPGCAKKTELGHQLDALQECMTFWQNNGRSSEKAHEYCIHLDPSELDD